MRVRVCGLLFVVSILIAVGSTVQPTLAACTPTYVVQRGDSWWSIAEKSETTLNALLRLNGAKKLTMLQPKDLICVPVDEAIPATTYTQKEIVQIIREVWPDELEERALAIARRESKLNPRVIGIPNKCCYGLFQIYYRWHKQWLPKIGVVRANQLLDPRKNAEAALEIYRRNNGWGPWE
jgi:soluble lytic murein transglycosylase-like protein